MNLILRVCLNCLVSKVGAQLVDSKRFRTLTTQHCSRQNLMSWSKFFPLVVLQAMKSTCISKVTRGCKQSSAYLTR